MPTIPNNQSDKITSKSASAEEPVVTSQESTSDVDSSGKTNQGLTVSKHQGKKDTPSVVEETSVEPVPDDFLIDRKVAQLKEQGRGGGLESLFDKSSEASNSPDLLYYLSKGQSSNWNSKVTNPKDGKKITCQHLSYAVAVGELTRREISNFDNPKQLAEHPSIKTGTELIDTPVGNGIAAEAYYFSTGSNDGLGKALYAAYEHQVNNKSDSVGGKKSSKKSYLLMSAKHAVAVTIDSSKSPGVKLNFFDPNNTTQDLILVLNNSSDVRKLDITKVISDNWYRQQIGMSEPGAVCLLSTETVDSPDQAACKIFGDLDSHMLYMLIFQGHANESRLQPIIKKSSENPDQLFSLWGEKVTRMGSLYGIMSKGRIEALHCYAKLLKTCITKFGQDQLNEEQLKQLVRGESSDGTLALQAALLTGDKKIIPFYCRMVDDLGMSHELSDMITSSCATHKKETVFQYTVLIKRDSEKAVSVLKELKDVKNLKGSHFFTHEELRNACLTGLGGSRWCRYMMLNICREAGLEENDHD
ncbi:MAG: hypothetical protein PUP46_02960 [Endozoicomonas sp. (ex Botrylloides leachii)]|nr:hypothetical protein [Endozoicomonas sp. (ex Botrylloides leachii)]